VRGLRAAGHEVTVLHVMDPAERQLDGSGEGLFVDPESNESVPVAVADVRAAYQTTVTAAIAEWREVIARAGATYELVMTDSPFGVPLRRAFAARQQVP